MTHNILSVSTIFLSKLLFYLVQIMSFSLEFYLNACSICLVCLDCQNIYDQNCTYQVRKVEWKRKKVKRNYTVDFCQRPLTQKGATERKVGFDKGLLTEF